MFIQYEKLTVASKLMNIFFQENQVPVLSWTSGKAIYQKDDSEYWNAFFDYISEDEFYKNIKETAQKYKLPLYSLIQGFFQKAKELDNTTNQKSSAEKYLQCLIFVELEAPANDTQRKIIEITNFVNIQLFHTGYHLIAEIDSDQLSHYQSEDPEINNFFPLQYWKQFQSTLHMKLEGNEVSKEYFERNMYKNIAKFIPFPDAIQIKNNDSLFLLQNANYLAYAISETLMKKGAHCIGHSQ